jgi:hypothetical protein
MIANGLTRERVAASLAPISDQSARANPIADAVYNRCGNISRGTTIMHAPHFWHSKRRTRTVPSSGAPVACAGPRTCRSRVPSP